MPSFTHTTACQDRDFPEWHGGRSHALLWALEPQAPELAKSITEARSRLTGLVLPRYDRQPHITVAFAGLAAEQGLPGYDNGQLAVDLNRLQLVIDGPVEVRATGWGIFPMVPYLGVGSAWLMEAHRVLVRGYSQDHQMSYVPHITLGHWADEWPAETVLARLQAPVPKRAWRLSALSLLRYETHDIAGSLETVGRLDLASGDWTPTALTAPGADCWLPSREPQAPEKWSGPLR